MNTINVALAAETILYTPIYLAAGRSLPQRVNIEILPTDKFLGDRNSYNRLGNGVDVCIADPMTVIPQNDDPPRGQVVGVLLDKVGLWGVSSCFTKTKISPEDSPFTHWVSDSEKKIKRVVGYDSASTAGRLIEKISSKEEHNFSSLRVAFGTELDHVWNVIEGDPKDFVVTCDLVGALAIKNNREFLMKRAIEEHPEYKGRAVEPNLVTEFCTCPVYGNAMFTAIIASNDLINNRKEDLLDFLNSIKKAVDILYRQVDNDIALVAKELIEADNVRPGSMFPFLENGFAGKVLSEVERQNHIVAGLRYIRERRLWSANLRVDVSLWENIYSIWFPSSVGKMREHYKIYVNDGPINTLAPAAWKAIVRRCAKNVRVYAVVAFAAFVFLGLWAGLLGRHLKEGGEFLYFGVAVVTLGAFLVVVRDCLGMDE